MDWIIYSTYDWEPSETEPTRPLWIALHLPYGDYYVVVGVGNGLYSRHLAEKRRAELIDADLQSLDKGEDV